MHLLAPKEKGRLLGDQGREEKEKVASMQGHQGKEEKEEVATMLGHQGKEGVVEEKEEVASMLGHQGKEEAGCILMRRRSGSDI